jgi:hypothetical protein
MILVENVLDKNVVKTLGRDSIKTLNEAIAAEVGVYKQQIENEMSIKFEKLVENISVKFSDQVERAIVENVKSRVAPVVDNKLSDVVSGMINILESAGIYNTEKSKELTAMLKTANQKLEDTFKEREVIREQLDAEKKINFILQRLSGMKPEIINSALAYFDKKDILDVQDEIDAFIEGDFDNLIHDDTDNFNDGMSEITLDQVDDALKDITSTRESNSVRARFESLGRGLSPQKGIGVNRNNSVSLDALTEGATDPLDDDTNLAMDQIANYRDLGYKFM